MPRAMTKDIYEKAVAYFREHPGDSAGCARHCGLHYRTARKMWTGPRSKLWPWMDPVEELLAKEKELELTEQEQREQDERLAIAAEADRAKKIEEQALAFEEQAMGVARVDILHGMAAINKLTRGITKLATDVNAQLERGVDAKGNPVSLDPAKCLNLIRSYTHSVRGLTQATETLVNLGRVQRNLPTAIVGLEVQSMTLEDAQREVEMANRALKRAQHLGLQVIEGEGHSVG